ncbi:MAG: hypothetical protein CMJ48_12150 [Planctomycetaceae bacterium]|nr:hypothetical protein [Planctomycetaceae bacterium]
MDLKTKSVAVFLAGAMCVLAVTAATSQDAATRKNKASDADKTAKSYEAETGAEDEVERMTIEQARARGALLHDTWKDSLMVIHRIYFREGEKITIPSRAMDDIFARMEHRSNIKSRWIAVNAQAMSLDHKPRDQFEFDAAKALSLGEDVYEVVEDGVYRRAGPITLFSSCLKCHFPSRTARTRGRIAGLVISIPVETDATTGAASK